MPTRDWDQIALDIRPGKAYCKYVGMSTSVSMTEEQVDLISRALAEPRRRTILKQIAERSDPMPCADILLLHDVGAPTVSRHLKELQTAGLITSTRNGKCMDYSVRREVWQAYLEHLATL